jgi:hypothetical protein
LPTNRTTDHKIIDGFAPESVNPQRRLIRSSSSIVLRWRR